MFTDPIADYLTRVRNAQMAGHKVVEIPASNMKKAITKILHEKGYILNFKFEETENNQGNIKVALKYNYGDNLNTRFVSMPTHHTRFIARAENRSEDYIEFCSYIPETGELPDPLPEILELIAEHDVVFNTGHLSGEEAVRLIESAKLRGINRILVPSSHYEPEIVKEISNQNCYAEFSFFCISKATEVGLTHIDEEKHKAQPVKIAKMKELIKSAGINNTILSSDCGVSILPIPVEGFAKFLLTIKKQGFSEKEIKIMSSINPSMLFKIKDYDSN